MTLGWPLSTPGDLRQPESLRTFHRGTAPRSASRPSDATATGYHNDGYQLWIGSAVANQEVFVVRGQKTESWVRVPAVPGCN